MTYKITPARIEKMRVLGMTFLFLDIEGPNVNKVNMLSGSFHPCGTHACHAGFFAIANNKENDIDYSFNDSAGEMAQYLGFKKSRDLELWALENPKMWGNNYGEHMFCTSYSFMKTFDTITLKDIGLHWLKVADRCEESLKG